MSTSNLWFRAAMIRICFFFAILLFKIMKLDARSTGDQEFVGLSLAGSATFFRRD